MEDSENFECFTIGSQEAADILGVNRTRLSQLTSKGIFAFERRKIENRNRLFYRLNDLLNYQRNFNYGNLDAKNQFKERFSKPADNLQDFQENQMQEEKIAHYYAAEREWENELQTEFEKARLAKPASIKSTAQSFCYQNIKKPLSNAQNSALALAEKKELALDIKNLNGRIDELLNLITMQSKAIEMLNSCLKNQDLKIFQLGVQIKSQRSSGMHASAMQQASCMIDKNHIKINTENDMKANAESDIKNNTKSNKKETVKNDAKNEIKSELNSIKKSEQKKSVKKTKRPK